MDKKELKIIIAGHVGTGKSTIAELICNTLAKENFSAILVNPIDEPSNPETFEKRLESLRSELSIVVVEEKQLRIPINDNFKRQRRCHDCPKTSKGTRPR